ncbi:MAG: coproporphyrinogen III oxidase family protein [Spirochaetaceae bacterium]|jgi:oxygen-independent coproporphyrinogen-3 oxidase|nr:coproporphyrinogen III oxidase family protein [Spirochaetaceae bacterium]
MEASIYIHIPFCSRKCDYCDFYSVDELTRRRGGAEVVVSYIERIITDIREQTSKFHVDSVPSIYIGGGTPSVLEPALLERLLASLPLTQELTIEANPESCSDEFLSVCKAGGVNRLSIGVQSFNTNCLVGVGRGYLTANHANHANNMNGFRQAQPPVQAQSLVQAQPPVVELVETTVRVVRAVRGYFKNWSADLITGLPYQTPETLLSDIRSLLQHRPPHISLYALTVEPGTPLARRVGEGTVPLPTTEDADTLWLLGRDSLMAAGYKHYEVSNFCLPGYESIHNMRYWQMRNWIAAGASASGTIISHTHTNFPPPLAGGVGGGGALSGFRYTYKPDVEVYISGEAPLIEELDEETLIKESLMMGYRTNRGPDMHLFEERFGFRLEDAIPCTLAKYPDADIERRLLFLNSFVEDAFEEISVFLQRRQSRH